MVSRRLLPVAILVLLWGHSVLALAEHQALREMHRATWTASDGAPQNITQLAQDPDGSLWIGSESGLFNFDGQTFRPWQAGADSPVGGLDVPAAGVSSLLVTKAGALWVAFHKTGLARLTAGQVTWFDTAEGKRLGPVEQLRGAPDGSIWAIEGRQRLIRFASDGAWRAEPAPTAGPISGILVDSSGTLWVAQDGHLYRRPPSQRSYTPTEVRVGAVTGFAETPNREVWISDHDPTTSRGRMHEIAPTGQLIRTHPEGLPSSGALVSAADGSLLVTSFSAGLRRLSPEELSLPANVRSNAAPDIVNRSHGLSTGATRAVMIDAHGNIWIGSLRGLDRLRPAQLTRYLPAVRDIGALCATSRGDVWVANSLGELYSMSAAVATRVREGGVPFFSLACADLGRAWFADSNGFWSVEDGRVVPLPRLAGAREHEFIRIAAASDGTLYATVTGTLQEGGGVWRYAEGQWAKLDHEGDLGAGGYSAYIDHGDRLWIGYTRGRAILHNGNQAQMISSGHPGLGTVHSFVETSRGLFAAGTNGLALLRGSRFEMLTYAEPSLVRGVRGMVEARNGDLWLNGANGFAQVVASELDAAIVNPTHPIKVRLVRDSSFAKAGGPHSVISYWDTVARDSEGQLWFTTRGATRGELIRIDPESAIPTNDAPRLTIRSIVVDGHQLGSDREVAAAPRMVNIHYFGIQLTAPENVIYRYRLEGFDESWREAGPGTEAVYTRLPPGRYTFHVMASSGDGLWTEPVSSAPFTVLPSFYQTWWFAAAMVGLGILLVGVVHRARVRQLSRVMNMRFDERLAERTRVAREVHDTLLQTIHGSKLVADRALRDASDPEKLVRALSQLSKWLGDASAEGRVALQALRVSTIERNDLAGALRRAIDESRDDSGAEVSLTVAGSAREMHPVVRDEVYRIGYEAIRNACVHSHARRIEVLLEYGPDLKLHISDDGDGIDAAVLEKGREGHFGLRGMRERAERIGGKLTLTSSAGAGTLVTLIVPGNIVFQSGPLSSDGQSMRG